MLLSYSGRGSCRLTSSIFRSLSHSLPPILYSPPSQSFVSLSLIKLLVYLLSVHSLHRHSLSQTNRNQQKPNVCMALPSDLFYSHPLTRAEYPVAIFRFDSGLQPSVCISRLFFVYTLLPYYYHLGHGYSPVFLPFSLSLSYMLSPCLGPCG